MVPQEKIIDELGTEMESTIKPSRFRSGDCLHADFGSNKFFLENRNICLCPSWELKLSLGLLFRLPEIT